MNPCNAVIKKWTINETELYCHCLKIDLELKLQGGGGCCFIIPCVYAKEWQKNQLGYAVKRILEITEADSIENITGKPIRVKFKGEGKLGDSIIGIGHILNEDWLIPCEDDMWEESYSSKE